MNWFRIPHSPFPIPQILARMLRQDLLRSVDAFQPGSGNKEI